MFRRKKDYKYDFLPSNLEIIERPPSPLGGFIIYLISFSIVVLVILAFIFQIDIVVTTTGTIDVENGIKIVNSNSTSKILSIDKKQGDVVKKDDIIMRFETDNEKDIESMKNEITLSNLKIAILETEIDKIRNDSIFDNYDIESLKRQELQLEYEIYWNNHTEKNRQYELQKNKIEMRYQKKELTEDERKEIDSELVDISINYNQDKSDEKLSLLSQLNSEKEQIKNYEDNLAKLNKLNDDKIVKSPVDGTILIANYNTVGTYISPNINIVEIVPSGSKFIVKTKIVNKDISKIKMGQSVTVKIDAYDYQTFGGLQGKISYISATSKLSDDKNSLNYEVEIEIVKPNKKMELKSGMTVSIDIKTDRKKIIEYIFEPIMKTVDDAF